MSDTISKPSQQIYKTTSSSPLIKEILASTDTRIQALRRLRILKEYVSFVLYSSPKIDYKKAFIEFEKKFLERSRKEETSLIEKEKEKDLLFIQKIDPKILEEFQPTKLEGQLKEIETAINQATTIIFHIPFDIPNEQITELASWVKKNIDPQSLVDFKYDPGLIGGCAISYKGVYKDFSLKDKIKQNQKPIIDSLVNFKNEVSTQKQRKILTNG